MLISLEELANETGKKLKETYFLSYVQSLCAKTHIEERES